MLNSKQRARLRAMSNKMDTILQIGKDGIGDNLIKQASDALAKRELIKIRVLETAMYTAKEAAEELSTATMSETVQVIGSGFVLYRKNPELKEKSIVI